MTATFIAPRAGRLVDIAKAHLVTVLVGDVGPLIAAGGVLVDDRVGAIGDLVEPGAVLRADATKLASYALSPEDVALAIPFEDDDLVIVDKPAGMHVHPLGPHRTGTLLNAMLWHCGARPDEPWAPWRPAPVHRLDRATSGLVIFSKSAVTHDALGRQLATHAIARRYEALVAGVIERDTGTIDAPIGRDPVDDYRRAIVPIEQGGQRAITHWRVVERLTSQTRLELDLETGRTHQIRVHLASIGHPIVGDTLYAPDRGPTSLAIALHARELRLVHPRTGEPLHVRSGNTKRRRGASHRR